MSTVNDFLDSGDDGAGAATGTAVTDSSLDALIKYRSDRAQNGARK